MDVNPRTSAEAAVGGSASKLLITAAGAAMAPLLRWSEPTHRAFADRHGYDVVVHRLQDDPQRTSAAVRRAKWAKVELLAAALDVADIVLWLDADAMVLDDADDPATHLAPDRFQAMAIEAFADRQNPNTGVWLMRRDVRSRSFLEQVLEIGQLPHSWADQATVCQLLGWDVGDHHGHGARRVRTTSFFDGTSWLPPEWNVTSLPIDDAGDAFADRVRIRHFAGLPLDERAARMHELYEDWKELRHGRHRNLSQR